MVRLKLSEAYASQVVERPWMILGAAVLVVVAMAAGASNVETVNQGNEDLLPDTVPSINAFEVFSQDFSTGGGSSYTVLVETTGEGVEDVRDPELLRFIELLDSTYSSYDEVVNVDSAADLVENPASIRETSSQFESSGRSSSFVSDDYSFTIIRIQTAEISTDEEAALASEIREATETKETPPGIQISFTGSPFIDQAFQRQSSQTQGLTTMLSLVGVLAVVILLFRSVVKGLSSLTALIIGVVAGFGTFGWLGLNISPATSGAVSMGIGIAIDFGIQTVSRFREERQSSGLEESVQATLEGVFRPMTVALVAAMIGFYSLTLGRITFLSDLGTMLALITAFAYLSSLTVIPVVLTLQDRWNSK